MRIRPGYILSVLLLLCNAARAQVSTNFERGPEGWSQNGNGKVEIDRSHQRNGNACIRLNNGGMISCRLPVAGLSVVQFGIFAKAETTANVYCHLLFYDSLDKLLMRADSKLQCDTGYKNTGNYTQAPPYAKYMVIDFQKDSSDNKIYLDDFSYTSSHGIGSVDPLPQVDIDQYMKPFWASDTIFNETVLLYSTNGEMATGGLLYQPSKILSVKSYDLRTTYVKDKDFRLKGNVVSRVGASAISYVADTMFHKNNLAWYEIQSRWVVVTYTHKDRWKNAYPQFKASLLPHTLSKLKNKEKINIAAYGMSITKGMNASGFDSVPPYLPSYVDLFTQQLRTSYHYDDITMYNAALPGATAEWGAENAEQYIVPLKPDLVILDFGMNDFWRFTPEEFRGYLDTMIRKIRAANPQAEFLLIANMRFDPDYILKSDTNRVVYLKNFDGYQKLMLEMQTKGIITFDMTALSEAVYKLKKAKDCIANPLHPNDYLARWYAQGMSALFIPGFGEGRVGDVKGETPLAK